MIHSLRFALVPASLLVGALTFAPAASADPGQIMQPAPSMRIHSRHSHSTASDLISEALSEVSLHGDQKGAVDAIKKDVAAKHAAVKQAKKDLLEAVADQVDAGTFDKKAIKAIGDDLVVAEMAEAKAQRTALDKLHMILDKGQRDKLATAVEARVDHDKSGVSGREELAKIAKILKLDPGQEKAIAVFMKDAPQDDGDRQAQAKEHEHKLLDSFRGDKFDALKALPPSAARERNQAEIGRMIGVVEKLLPVLTPEQRARCAEIFRDRSTGSGSLKI